MGRGDYLWQGLENQLLKIWILFQVPWINFEVSTRSPKLPPVSEDTIIFCLEPESLLGLLVPAHSLQSVARMILKIKLPIGSYQLNTPLSLPKDLKVKPRLPFLHPCSWSHSFWPWVFASAPYSAQLSPHVAFQEAGSLSFWFQLNCLCSNGYFLAVLAIGAPLLSFLTFFWFAAESSYHNFAATFCYKSVVLPARGESPMGRGSLV